MKQYTRHRKQATDCFHTSGTDDDGPVPPHRHEAFAVPGDSCEVIVDLMRVVLWPCLPVRYGGPARQPPTIAVAAVHDGAVMSDGNEARAIPGHVAEGFFGSAVGGSRPVVAVAAVQDQSVIAYRDVAFALCRLTPVVPRGETSPPPPRTRRHTAPAVSLRCCSAGCASAGAHEKRSRMPPTTRLSAAIVDTIQERYRSGQRGCGAGARG